MHPLWTTTPDALRTKIFSRCEINDHTGCWVWQGGRSNGYGIVSTKAVFKEQNRPVETTHRAMYILMVGEPKGVIHHRCENRLCCNPDHMDDVSAAEHAHI